MALDSFGRQRVSQPQTLFDSKQIYDNQDLFWVTGVVAGGSAAWNQARASTVLTVTGANGAKVTRQTRRYFNYQPGKAQEINATAIFGAGDVTLRREVGLFDDDNGIFLRQEGSNVWCVQRSKASGVVVDTAVPQSQWNGDRFLGSGRGGVLDLAKAQVMFFEYEWLGTGPSRIGFVTPEEEIIYAHTFRNPNNLSVVYMSTPNLPVRYQIERISAGGADATLEQVCTSVMSEGGQQPIGAVWAADRDVTVQTVPAANYVPVISIRLKAGHLRRTVVPLNLQLHQTSAGTSVFRVLFNPTRGAGTAPTWVPRNATLSSVEFDVASTQVITDGHEIQAGYVVNGAILRVADLPTQLVLGAQDIAGTVPDEIVVAARSFAGNESVVGAISWVEL